MPWSLVTAPDERERCCFVDERDVRCEQPSAFKLSGTALDEYTYVCDGHLEIVRASSFGCAVERLAS